MFCAVKIKSTSSTKAGFLQNIIRIVLASKTCMDKLHHLKKKINKYIAAITEILFQSLSHFYIRSYESEATKVKLDALQCSVRVPKVPKGRRHTDF